MKLKGLALLFVILISFPDYSYTRNFKNKQFALFNYQVNMPKAFRKRIENIESYINSNFEFKLSAEDKFEAIIYYIVYNRIQKKLENDVHIDVLPITSFLHNAKYNEYGYPTIGIQRAILHGDSHYYFKVQVNIEAFLSKKAIEKLARKDSLFHTNYKLADNNSLDSIQPEISIEMSIFNKDGVIPVKKAFGAGYEKEPAIINESFLYGIIPGEARKPENSNCLSAIIDKAIDDLVRKLH